LEATVDPTTPVPASLKSTALDAILPNKSVSPKIVEPEKVRTTASILENRVEDNDVRNIIFLFSKILYRFLKNLDLFIL